MSQEPRLVRYKGIGVSVVRTFDYVLIVVAYLLAQSIAGLLSGIHEFRYPTAQDWRSLEIVIVPLSLVSWSIVSGFHKPYDSHRDESLPYLMFGRLKTVGAWVAVCLAGMFLAKLQYNSRQFIIEFFICATVLLEARLIAVSVLLRRLRQSGYDQKTALVIGDLTSCDKFVKLARLSHPMGYNFVRILLGPTGQIADEKDRELVDSGFGDEIFMIGAFAHPASSDNLAIRFLRSGKAVHIVPEVADARLFRQMLGEIGGMPVLSISCGQLTGLEAMVKRAVDLACASILLVLGAPLILLTAALIRLTSEGPVLFRQTRLGRSGRQFTLLKFRSMHINAEQQLLSSSDLYQRYVANNYKLPVGDDPRVTAIGKVLRALSIDELPQLFNVLKGEMSLVGPRPIVPMEIEKYGEFAHLFLSVKPGMTGHWQVSGRSDVQEYNKRIELDLEYVRDQSIRTDLEILLRTVPVVLRRKGAY